MALYSALSPVRTDILPSTAGLRLGVATVLVHTRLQTVTTKLSQFAPAVKFVVHQSITIKHGLSSARLEEVYGCILPSVSLTAHLFFQPLQSLISGTLWNYTIYHDGEGDHQSRLLYSRRAGCQK